MPWSWKTTKPRAHPLSRVASDAMKPSLHLCQSRGSGLVDCLLTPPSTPCRLSLHGTAGEASLSRTRIEASREVHSFGFRVGVDGSPTPSPLQCSRTEHWGKSLDVHSLHPSKGHETRICAIASNPQGLLDCFGFVQRSWKISLRNPDHRCSLVCSFAVGLSRFCIETVTPRETKGGNWHTVGTLTNTWNKSDWS